MLKVLRSKGGNPLGGHVMKALATWVCLFWAALAAAVACRTAAADQTVTLTDPNLEAAVRARLGIPAPTPITQADMLGLTVLQAYYSGIQDLAGLEYATAARALFLYDNNIVSLEPLSDLGHLSELVLAHNCIADISPLAGLTKLGSLMLGSNEIEDVSPFSNLSHLNLLMLDDNRIKDVSALAGLSAVEHLCLTGNQVTDISPLVGLPRLRILELAYNNISDISPLDDIRNLVALDIRGNPLNARAYEVDIPLIMANNPRLQVFYDPIPEPGTLSMLCAGIVLALRMRRG
jgi:hypothetical protein